MNILSGRIITASLLILAFIMFYSDCRAEREATVKYVTYGDNNRAFIDTASVSLSLDVTSKTKLMFSGILDAISGASRKIPVIDGMTTATTRVETDRIEKRKEYSAGIAQKILSHTISTTVDQSREADYSSNSYFISWMYEFNNRNNALTLAYSNFQDKLSPFGVTWRDIKLTRVYDLSFTSVLTTSSQLRAITSYGHEFGYLSNPYHRIIIDDFYFKERHPVVRDNLAFGLFYNLGFPGEQISAIQLDYRYYLDTWKIYSHTIGVKFSQHITDWLIVSLRERYYSQNAAFFFKNSYDAEERFMTSDPKLGTFSSTLSGIGFNIEVDRAVSLEILYEQYNQRSNIDYNLINQSVVKADLASHILYLSTTVKF